MNEFWKLFISVTLLFHLSVCRLATDSEVMLLCPASSSRAHGHDLGPKTASVAQVVMFLMGEHLGEHGRFYSYAEQVIHNHPGI
jgi:hypothetical protein